MKKKLVVISSIICVLLISLFVFANTNYKRIDNAKTAYSLDISKDFSIRAIFESYPWAEILIRDRAFPENGGFFCKRDVSALIFGNTHAFEYSGTSFISEQDCFFHLK
jgi:hypothetical protein